jgi:hypothetical protein
VWGVVVMARGIRERAFLLSNVNAQRHVLSSSFFYSRLLLLGPSLERQL